MFNYYWSARHLKFSEIFMLLFFVMITFTVIPEYIWGDEIYAYTDKNGTMNISNTQPQEDINLTTDLDGNSYQDSTSNERLHWGRDSALIDVQKRRYGQSKTVKDDRGMDAGRYDVNIKKIANNLYQDISTRMIIKTLACVELAGSDGSSLHWSGIAGELFFQNTNKTCMVKKVYK